MINVRKWSWRPRFNLSSSLITELKMALAASLLNFQYYKVWIKGKWSNSEEGVSASLTPHCCSY